MSQKILGIDPGTYSLKVLHLERRVQDLKVLNYFEEPLDHHARTAHEEQVSGALTKILSENALETDVVCASLPGHFMSTRILELPFTGRKRISQVVTFELEGYIPFPVEDIFLDFHVLRQADNQSQVLCVYVHEDNLRKYLDALSGAGGDPKYCAADFTDLAGIAQLAMVPRQGFYALCDIGHSKTNVVIMEGRQLRYVRTIGIGGHHFTRAIQRSFNLNFDKAEAIKLSRGKLFVHKEESDQVSLILDRVAQELVSSIKLTFLGARRYLKDLSVPAIFVCGGGAKMLGMIDYLSFHLRTNVFELDTLNFVHHEFDDPQDVNKTIPQVLASTLRPIYSTRFPKINFRKGPFTYKQDIQLLTRELRSVGVFVGVLVLLGLGYYFYADYHFEKKISMLETKVVELAERNFKDLDIKKPRRGGSVKTGKQIRDYLRAAKRKLRELKDSGAASEEGMTNVVDLIYQISVALPPKKDVNFEVNELNFSNDFIRLDASTNDTFNREKIVSALQDAGKFARIEATDTKQKPGGKYEFTIKITFKEGGQE